MNPSLKKGLFGTFVQMIEDLKDKKEIEIFLKDFFEENKDKHFCFFDQEGTCNIIGYNEKHFGYEFKSEAGVAYQKGPAAGRPCALQEALKSREHGSGAAVFPQPSGRRLEWRRPSEAAPPSPQPPALLLRRRTRPGRSTPRACEPDRS